MDLRSLRYFLYVKRLGSFTRAAAELNIAQPSLSRQIKQLEEELGVELLVRQARGVVPTRAGEMLAKKAELLADIVRGIKGEITDNAPPITGRLSVAFPPFVGVLLVPPIVDRFQRQYPNVSIHFTEGSGNSIQEWLLDSRIDIGVLHLPPAFPNIKMLPLIKEPMYVVGPPIVDATGEKPRKAFRVAELQDLPLIMPTVGNSIRSLMEQVALQHRIRLNVVMEIDGFNLRKEVVKGGYGYTILRGAAVQEHVARAELRAYPIIAPAVSTTLSIVVLRDGEPNPVRDLMIKTIKDVLKDFVRAGIWPGKLLYD
jgi:LysR family nitrogen assimilation transcriptional regulator